MNQWESLRFSENSLNLTQYGITKFFQWCYFVWNSVNFHWISDSYWFKFRVYLSFEGSHRSALGRHFRGCWSAGIGRRQLCNPFWSMRVSWDEREGRDAAEARRRSLLDAPPPGLEGMLLEPGLSRTGPGRGRAGAGSRRAGLKPRRLRAWSSTNLWSRLRFENGFAYVNKAPAPCRKSAEQLRRLLEKR